MDYFLLGNALLMFGAFALQFGMMGSDDEGSETSSASETTETEVSEPEALIYDPALYGTEELGTTGDDVVDLAASPLNVAVFLDEGNDVLDASINDDYAEGGAGNDEMSMRPGDDIALGGAGDDTIDGGLGDDTLYGGDGNDLISGGNDDDEVHGDAGDDTLLGSRGNDSLDGGSGDDVLYGNTDAEPGLSDDGNDTLSGGDGNDALHLGGDDQGTGGAGADNFLLYDPGDSGTIAEVTDYNADDDVIGVVYTPTTDPDTGDPVVPSLSVSTNDEGTIGFIALDGVEIARIIGGQDLTVGDIALIAQETD